MGKVAPPGIRRLTPDDRPRVSELVRGVDPDDWVLAELDWLLAGSGLEGPHRYGTYGLEVAGGRLGAIGLLTFSAPGEVHLSALRVARDLQGQGYGSRFLQGLLELAAGAGGRRAWFISAVENLRMHRVARRLGFTRQGEWQIWLEPELAPLPPGGLVLPHAAGPVDLPPGGLSIRPGTPADREAVAGWLQQHPPVGEEGVTAAEHTLWEVTPLGPEHLAARLEAGELVIARTGSGPMAGLMACHWGTEEPPEFRVRYLRGTGPAVGNLLAWARNQVQARPGAVLGIGLPGPQAALVRPWVTSARQGFLGYVFVRTLAG